MDTTATPDRADGESPRSRMIYLYGIKNDIKDGIIKTVYVCKPSIKTVELTYTDTETGAVVCVEEVPWEEIAMSADENTQPAAPVALPEQKAFFRNSARFGHMPLRHALLHGGTPLRHVADVWRQDDATLAAHLFFDPSRHAEAALRFEKHVFGLVEKTVREKFRNWREAKVWIAENAGTRAIPSTNGPRRGGSGTILHRVRGARAARRTRNPHERRPPARP